MYFMQRRISLLAVLLLGHSLGAAAQVLPEAVDVMQMTLAVKPTSRPMSVAFDPDYSRYIVADGGFTAMPDEFGVATASGA